MEEQKQEWVRLHGSFQFHRKYIRHDRFQVTITDQHGAFQYEVRWWDNMIRSVRAFTEEVALPGAGLAAKVQIYRTGNAEVNGYLIRVVPVS
ncbi:hypothetical protein ACFY5K_25585 [Streptomyces griseofuscus]|uniref:hypothetical protein n=1 Tax=Streptomyces griseofuscus TaxID=146922 RepID=UPI0036982510